MSLTWKPNFNETKRHFIDWWNHDGLVLGMWGHGYPRLEESEKGTALQSDSVDLEAYHTDPEKVASRWHETMSRFVFPADVLPVVRPSAGTVDLASYLGAKMSFQEKTVWYDPLQGGPDDWPELVFDPANIWYSRMEETLKRMVDLASDDYLVGFPGISPNLDVLAELRGTGELMMDFFDRPDWVKQKLNEIDEVYFEVYDRMYEIIKQPDGSSAFYPFMLWGPGKVTQLQGDAAAMISEEMFREFMLPGLARVAEWTDYRLFHVDGPDMTKHVDALLEIDALDAIQFTPGPAVPPGADPHWHAMYRRILDAGKSLQAVWIKPHEVIPLLDIIGSKGVYLMVDCQNAAEMSALAEQVQAYR